MAIRKPKENGLRQITWAPACLAALVCSGCVMHLDRPTEIAVGHLPRPVYSVDGGVHLAARAEAGKIRSVHGGVTLGEGATAKTIDTVDGPVALERGATCRHDLSAVDRRVSLAPGGHVGGNVRTLVAGLDGHDAEIAGAIHTVSGKILLHGTTHVGKGICLDKPRPSTDAQDEVWKRLPRVVIGPGVVVDGPIVAARGGTLWVSRQARIGAVEGIRTQWFDGATPPGPAGMK